MGDGSEADEIVREFLVESHEGLDQLDLDLVALEQQGADDALLGRIFRCVHTIKGTCGFLGFGALESVAHVGENLLARLRDREIAVSPERTGALLALVDAIREMLASIERTGDEGDADYHALRTRLSDAALDLPLPAPVAADEPAVPTLGEILVAHGYVAQADVEAAMHEQRLGNPARVGEILVARGVTSPAAIRDALAAQTDVAAARGAGNATIRVDVALLDRLMNLVGELVLTRNQLLQGASGGIDDVHAGAIQRLDHITTQLQAGVMKTRMQPIGSIWSKLPRVVRDLALACGKQVGVEFAGAETELDKTIIEAIKDPLTHIVRNAVDHGIEPPGARLAAGKPAQGRLVMRAFHEGGKVNVEIRDDGAGIDPASLRAKAVERGILSPGAANGLGERETLQLIFAPGFSTAARVTNVSGRGVGMDVVKTNIERIGGTVDVSSVPGQGTALRIRIPLTLAIIQGLVVVCAGDRYAIPQANLLELVRLEGEQALQRIEHVYGAPVCHLRGQLLPLVPLDEALGLAHGPWRPDAASTVNIVVLQAEGTPFGVIIDDILDTEEIVVKPLGRQLEGIAEFAGATIMGDGKVALIIDVVGLAQRRGIVGAGSSTISGASSTGTGVHTGA